MAKTKKAAKALADRWFSKYVRKRDADKYGVVKCCITGERFHWKNLDAGHFMSRRHESTRYDEHNTGPQSRFSNRFNQGDQYLFGKYLDKRYGEGTSERMMLKSRMTCIRNRYDYEQIAEEYKNKFNDLPS